MLYVLICVVCLWAMTVSVAVSFSRRGGEASLSQWIMHGVFIIIFLPSMGAIPSSLNELFSVIMFGFLLVLCWITFKGMLNQLKS